MGWLSFLKSAATDIPTPATGKVAVYVDSTSDQPAYKDDSGATHTLVGANGVVQSIVAGTNVTVDNTDPENPVVSASGGGGGVDKSVTVNAQTGTAYTLVLGDAYNEVAMNNASANVATINPTTVGDKTYGWVRQTGAGATTVAVASGTLVQAGLSLTTKRPGAALFWRVVGTTVNVSDEGGAGLPVTGGTVTGAVVVDSTALPPSSQSFVVKAALNNNVFSWQSNTGVELWHAKWDGGTFHQYLGAAFHFNMAGNSFIIDGNSLSTTFTLTNGATIHLDGTTVLIPFGYGTYATASITLTAVQAFSIRTFAWNGSSGSSIVSTFGITMRQLSTSANSSVVEWIGYVDGTQTGASYYPATGSMVFVGDLTASTIAGVVKTVSTLPAAASVPVGACTLASNARKLSESAGAGTGCPVWSDGTNWRTFYDNSVAAA